MVDLHHHLTVPDLRVLERLVEVEDRAKADLFSFEERGPFVAGPGQEHLGQLPGDIVQLLLWEWLSLVLDKVLPAELLTEGIPELRLDAGDGDILAVLAEVYVGPGMCTGKARFAAAGRLAGEEVVGDLLRHE